MYIYQKGSIVGPAMKMPFIGPFLVASVTAATMSQKAGMVMLIAFFVVGLLLLMRVKDYRPAP